MKGAAARGPRSLIGPAIVAACAFAVLVSLGVWQLQRKAWKEALIETMSHRAAARPIDLPARASWSALMPSADEFRRVKLRAQFIDTAKQAFVYTGGSALRDDIKAPGYFVFAPARLPDGSVVAVNRGYAARQDAVPARGSADLVGYLRFPDSGSMFVADHDAAGTTWFVRDQKAMAQTLGWGEVAPFYIDQESPVPAGGVPKPGPLKVQLRNDHLGYALTWFGLAAGLAAVFGVWAWPRRRKRA
jgi:cytochrome oxidase assembly protein ShyY1